MEDEEDKKIPGREHDTSQVPVRSVGGMPSWLPIAEFARVEVSSEDPEHPIQHALVPHQGAGWRAAKAGKQLIRIRFDEPRTIRRIYLHFEEPEVERTQEFVLRWADSPTGPPTEVVRQQWNFSPSGSTHEIEDYRPSPHRVTLLELEIVPDVAGGDARASLQQLHLA